MRYGPFRGLANVQQRREKFRKLPSILIYKERTERTGVGVCVHKIGVAVTQGEASIWWEREEKKR